MLTNYYENLLFQSILQQYHEPLFGDLIKRMSHVLSHGERTAQPAWLASSVQLWGDQWLNQWIPLT